jgi:molecular chaperone HtpG
MSQSIITAFKSALGDRVEDVTESQRLVNSPVTLVGGKNAPDSQMEKMMQMFDKDFSASKKVLEINMSHEIIKNLAKIALTNPNDPRITKAAMQLFEGALLLEGQLKSPTDFVSRMHEILAEGLK